MANHQRSPKNIVRALKEKFLIMEVPSYGNKLFYSLGFLALTCLAILVVSGVIMVFFGPTWWLANPWGIFFRSIHLWAAQAFILIIILHVVVVFSTSGFKAPRRLTWVIGAIVFILALMEAEFGYGLRGDFSSQYRALQSADFFNGAFLGKFINTLNYAQIYGLHIIEVPIIIVSLLFLHYILVKIRGIAKPYREDIKYVMVPADHTKLFLRGGILVALIIILAYIFPSPFIAPITIAEVANDNPSLTAQTLMQEFLRTSDTATYLDSIDPYRYDTRAVYITIPYQQYVVAADANNEMAIFDNESSTAQQGDIGQAQIYFQNAGTAAIPIPSNNNPVISVVNSLVSMAKSGLYESALNGENINIRSTYSLRFMADTGVLDAEASQLHITTEQWGMMHEEKGALPPGAWWLAPLGILNHTVLANDANGDRDAAEILGLLSMLFVFFPYIPYLNRLPEKLNMRNLSGNSASAIFESPIFMPREKKYDDVKNS